MGLLRFIWMAFFLPYCAGVTSGTPSPHGVLANHSRALSAEDDKQGNKPHGFDELAASSTEERGGMTQLAEKVAHEWTPLKEHFHLVFPTKEIKMNDVTLESYADRLMKYPADLSPETMEKIKRLEGQRGTDFQKVGNVEKIDGKSLQKDIDPTLLRNVKIAPKMVSNIGRGKQKVEKGLKMMAAGVVVNDKGSEVLLISSSKMSKVEWILPKGGWEEGEGYLAALNRELVEEAGIKGTTLAKLVDVKILTKDDSFKEKGTVDDKVLKTMGSLWKPSIVRSDTQYDVWPEDMRLRIWVPFSDANKILEHMGRKQMAGVVTAAEEALKKNPKLITAKVSLTE